MVSARKRRRYTWKSPGDKERFSIDYILVRQRFRNGVKRSWSYPGADIYTDHNLVAMQMNVKLKKIQGVIKKGKKWNIDSLKQSSTPFQKSIQESISSSSAIDINER